MLAGLQKHLDDIYQTECGHQLADYLITDKTLADCIGQQPIGAGIEETVLVTEDDDGLALSVYLDQALLVT